MLRIAENIPQRVVPQRNRCVVEKQRSGEFYVVANEMIADRRTLLSS